MSDTEFEILAACAVDNFFDPFCRSVTLRALCYAYLELYQEHNDYIIRQSEAEQAGTAAWSCGEKWIEDANLHISVNCLNNGFKYRSECENWWFALYDYSLEDRFTICTGVRATEPGCEYY